MPINYDDKFWYKNAVFYELNVRAFADSNGDGHGDFRGMIDHLDHLMWLGVDCVWLLPFYPSPLRDDGYDIADFYNIAEPYGTLDDFKQMLEAYHAAGIRVIADLVVNHTSDRHPWFIESRSSKDNPRRDWYVWSDTDQKYQQTRIIFIDTETSNWAKCDISNEYYWHRFFSEQPDLNYDNPAVQEEMLNIMRFWLDMGLDGFRVDAVPYLFEREDTINENLPETHEYVKRMRRMVNEEYPGRILLAEANQPPLDTVAYLAEDEFHMGFHFPIMPRLFMGLAKQSATDIVNIMRDTPPIPSQAQWCIFLRNHDELTLEMVTPEEREFMWKFYAGDPRMKSNLGIRRRLASLLRNERPKLDMMNAVLLSLPGAPIIYYGDEIGMGDNFFLPDRNGLRTPMQWDTSINGGFSSAEPSMLYSPVIDDNIFGYPVVNVVNQRADESSLLNILRSQIEIRKANPILGHGQCTMLTLENEAVLAYERLLSDTQHQTLGGAKRILVLANLAETEQIVDVPYPGRYACLLSHQIIDTTQRLALSPHQFFWLRIE
jgi:maltose alpha-D-glucosyltransferase/alpha-amylase